MGLFLPHCSTESSLIASQNFNCIFSALKIVEMLSVETGYYRHYKFQRKLLRETLDRNESCTIHANLIAMN